MTSTIETTTEIQPFQIEIPDEALADLRRRIAATQWPEKETVSDESQGVPLATMQKLARHWQTEYDWREVESALNTLPQFITEIDGLDIHFVHVRSQHDDALPLVICHGWPGSIIEQLKLIDRLTDPTAHGGSATDAFHVVIPSMPGYGFSGKPTGTGLGTGAHGARVGGTDDATRVPPLRRPGRRLGCIRGRPDGPPGAGGPARHPHQHARHGPGRRQRGGARRWPATGRPLSRGTTCLRAAPQNVHSRCDYAKYMASRPQTLYGIADSPVGLAAWLLDHNDADGQPAAAVTSALERTTSATGELTRDEILDNITLYWLTNTGVSASRLYWEYKGGFFDAKGVTIPVAVTVFPGEQYQAPRSWAERAYPNLIYFNEVDKGGHFAAWEQPQLFAEELRAAFRSLR